MSTPIFIPSLRGGVSQLPQSQRHPQTVDTADNVEYYDGLSKRPGTVHISGEAVDESLDAANPTSDVFIQWFDRDDGERFVIIINPNLAAVSNDIIQIFDIEGNKQTVNYDSDDPRPYLTDWDASVHPDQAFRSITIADGIFVLNRTVETQRDGSAITYRANLEDLRKRTNPNNLPTWWDFPQPPDGTVPDGTVEDDNLYYAQQDEAGLPQGFYRAVSTTQPPWYERVRTEGANSEVDEGTMPIRIDFDGTNFTAKLGDYKPRLSGDDLLNPAASFFGNALSDLTFFQNRLWVSSLEQVVTSQINDLLNFWQDSPSIRVDSDPIDIGISEDRVSNIDFIVPFNNSLIAFTRSNKQLEIGAQGPFSPNTVFLRPLGSYGFAPYVRPIALSSMLIFANEKNFFNTVWAYHIDPETEMPQFIDITRDVDEYIPATIREIKGSERYNKLFVLTRAETHVMYVWEQGAWRRWVFNDDTEILSVRAIDERLYLLIRRDDKLWMESVEIGTPEDDTVGSGEDLQSMGYSVRLDRKLELTGVYDAVANKTTFTLPYLDADSDTIVLGPGWDTGTGDGAVRMAGSILTPEVSTVDGVTVLTVEGQWQKNAEDTDALAYVGRNYEMRARLNKQYVRGEEGVALFGNTQLLSGRLRFQDTVYFRIEVTPKNRFTREVEFHYARAGSTPLDGEYVQDHGEQFFRILGRNEDTEIEIVNDLPVPCTIVDGMLSAKYVPQRKTPT